MNDYTLTIIEKVRVEKFQKEHDEKCESGISVIFTQTGIANAVEVRCNKCQQIIDISDYSTW